MPVMEAMSPQARSSRGLGGESKGMMMEFGGYQSYPHQIGGSEVRVWTRAWSGGSPGLTPLVMVHGMGAGLAMFALNIPQLAR